MAGALGTHLPRFSRLSGESLDGRDAREHGVVLVVVPVLSVSPDGLEVLQRIQPTSKRRQILPMAGIDRRWLNNVALGDHTQISTVGDQGTGYNVSSQLWMSSR